MRLPFGFQLSRRDFGNLRPPTTGAGSGAWWPVVRESFPGAWQRNVEIRPDLVLAYHAVFACITLIANDVGKLCMRLIQETDDEGIWEETTSPAFSPFLKHPNHFQNPVQFRETWITSKLRSGNTYALKVRDQRGVVVSAYVLDPCRVKPLVSPDGMVFYELTQDNISGVADTVIVPQSEIFHDRMNCLFHPLVGLSPIFACGLAATQGLAAQNNSTNFFQNMSRPGGILIAPGPIKPDKAREMKALWDENFGGANAGKTAVLGDGVKYQTIAMTAAEAQMIDQLKWSAEVVCSCFHVPPFKLGFGPVPTYSAETMNQIYYSDCLQSLIEQYENVVSYGLGLDEPVGGRNLWAELNIDDLIRMDSATQITVLAEGVKGAIYTPNAARKKANQPPLPGGDTVYLQQQQFSIEALNERDQADPFAKPAAPAPALPAPAAAPADPEADQARAVDEFTRKLRLSVRRAA